jgi:hypothetical protein
MATVSPPRHARAIATVVAAVLATGCVRVRPHERENLARRTMIQDRDANERRVGQHAQGSREGADGGTGEPGGGCGCN